MAVMVALRLAFEKTAWRDKSCHSIAGSADPIAFAGDFARNRFNW